MDMDGVGTFAMFLSSGVIGAGLIWLGAYRMKLKAGLDRDRLHGSSNDAVDELRQEMHDLLAQQASQLDDLHERLDFTERLLSQGSKGEPGAENPRTVGSHRTSTVASRVAGRELPVLEIGL